MSDEQDKDQGATRGTDRRTFLKRAGVAGLIGAGFGTGAALTYDAKYPIKKRVLKGKELPTYVVPVQPGTPRVVIARGASAVANVRAALQELGGIEQFIKRGDRVLLKPNMAFDRTPAQGANTSPELVGELVRLCRAAGAKEVIVAENTLFDPERCVQSSGIGEAVRRAGGRVILPKKDSEFTEAILDGMALDTWPVMKLLFQVNKVINLPTAKHHRLARVSLGMKNWMGVIGGQRRKWHQKLDLTVTDIAAVLAPTLSILDGSRVLMKHGPTGGSLSDVKRGDTIIAGWDQVAVDRQALPLLGADLTEVKHISTAARRGLGKLTLKGRELVEIKT